MISVSLIVAPVLFFWNAIPVLFVIALLCLVWAFRVARRLARPQRKVRNIALLFILQMILAWGAGLITIDYIIPALLWVTGMGN